MQIESSLESSNCGKKDGRLILFWESNHSFFYSILYCKIGQSNSPQFLMTSKIQVYEIIYRIFKALSKKGFEF